MKKYIPLSILLSLALFSCGGSAETEKKSGEDSLDAGPKEAFPLVFETDSVDLGMVYSDDELPFFFKFLNSSGNQVPLPIEVNHEGNYHTIVHPAVSLIECGLLNFVYQFPKAQKGNNRAQIEVVLNGKSKKLKVNFNYAGEKSKRPQTQSNSIYPTYFFIPTEDGKYKIEIAIPNKGEEKLHIRKLTIEDPDIKSTLQTQILCGKGYNTHYIEPGTEGILILEADQKVLDKGKSGKLEFKITLDCNADIPPIRVRYMVLPG